MREAIGDPVDVLLDGDHHVADHGRAAGPGDGEEIGKAGDGDPEVGARSVGPLLPQRAAAPAADVDVEQGAGHGIEAGGEDDAVELVLGGLGPHTPRRDRLDRLAAEIDQGDVVAVERVVVVGVDADALGAERIVPGDERLGDRRIADYGADLGPEELGGGVIGLLPREEVRVRRGEAETAALPAHLVLALSLLWGYRQGRLVG